MEATEINHLFTELEAVPPATCRWCGLQVAGEGDEPSCPDCATRLVYPA
jgi:rubrerythrin